MFVCSLDLIPLGGKVRPVDSVTLSSRPDYRGQADKYPSVVAPPLPRAKIEIKLFPEHRLIVLSVYSTQGWALMRLTVIWRNILQPSSVRRAAGPGLLMPVWAAEEAESLLLSFPMTLLCPCRSGNMKCHRVLCACLKMSEIQQLVTHRSARGWWEIKGDSKTILLKITKTILQRVFRWCWHFWLSKATFWHEIHLE